MEDILKRKLVIIGSGRISKSHIEAAQANGFHLHGICSSENSQTALNLANEYNFANYYPNVENLLKTDFDAAAIICARRPAKDPARDAAQFPAQLPG